MSQGILVHLMGLQPASSSVSEATIAHWLEAFKAAADGSATMVTWALTAIIATIAAIVSTSYWRPAKLIPRLTYWLYLPGWILLALSIYFGDSVARRNIAAHFGKSDLLPEIAAQLNHDYICQQRFLGIGLLIFGTWLLMFLWWWIHGNWKPANDRKGA